VGQVQIALLFNFNFISMKYLLAIFLFNSFCLFAQSNLVPNSSFEEYNKCPNLINEIYPSTIGASITNPLYLKSWYVPTKNYISSDYYNACSPLYYPYSIPNNFLGFQNAKTGNGYVGIYSLSYYYNDLDSGVKYNQVEYLETKLLNPLRINRYYKLGYHISLAENLYKFNRNCKKSASSNLFINAHLSDSSIYKTADNKTSINFFQLNNAICIDTNKYFSDTLNWMKNSSIFKAKGGEQFLTLGNFVGFDSTKVKVLFEIKNDSTKFDHVFVSYYYIDDVSLMNVTHFIQGESILCPSGNGRLTATIAFDKYLWSNGSQDTFINITAPGMYWCTVQEGCSVYTDTFVVKAPTDSLPPPKPMLGVDIKTCTNELETWPQQLAIALPTNNETITWNTGALDDNKNTINVNAAGIYIVSLHNACLASADTIIVQGCPEPTIFIPTAFTPNDDALNDILHINTTGINPTSWQIYNRWGNMVYSTQNFFEWDGYYNGRLCENGTYYYVLRYTQKNKTEPKIFKGSLELLR
jgi:gliding motility-associated-like protein